MGELPAHRGAGGRGRVGVVATPLLRGGPHAIACAALLPDRCWAALVTVAPWGAPNLDWSHALRTPLTSVRRGLRGEDALRGWMAEHGEEYRHVRGEDLAAALGERRRRATTGGARCVLRTASPRRAGRALTPLTMTSPSPGRGGSSWRRAAGSASGRLSSTGSCRWRTVARRRDGRAHFVTAAGRTHLSLWPDPRRPAARPRAAPPADVARHACAPQDEVAARLRDARRTVVLTGAGSAPTPASPTSRPAGRVDRTPAGEARRHRTTSPTRSQDARQASASGPRGAAVVEHLDCSSEPVGRHAHHPEHRATAHAGSSAERLIEIHGTARECPPSTCPAERRLALDRCAPANQPPLLACGGILKRPP